MSDNLQKKDYNDRDRINIHESHEVAYWTKRFGVTEAQLKAAVAAVGVMVKDVQRHLGK